jgi:hypothetical protein
MYLIHNFVDVKFPYTVWINKINKKLDWIAAAAAIMIISMYCNIDRNNT